MPKLRSAWSIGRSARAHHAHQCERDGQHHGGRGRVAHPGRQGRGGKHDAQDDLLGLGAHDADHHQRDAAVQPPAGDAAGNEKAAQEEKDSAVGVVLERVASARNAEQRVHHDRQQGRHGNRHGLSEPPDAHPEHHGGTGTGGIGELHDLAGRPHVGRRQDEVQTQGQNRSEDEGNELGLRAQAFLKTGFVLTIGHGNAS